MVCTRTPETGDLRTAADLRHACELLIEDVCLLVQAARLGAIGIGHIAEGLQVDQEESEALINLLRLAVAKSTELRRIMLLDEAQP